MKYPLLIFVLSVLSCDPRTELSTPETDRMASNVLEVKQAPSPPESGFEKKVIKTGGIDFESEEIEEDYLKIKSLLPGFDAYIERENQSRTDERVTYFITIRVPANSYDSLYSSITNLAYRLDNKYSNVNDVTDRYYDLKTRITNKKALEERYLEILGRASEIKDILEVERNLNEVRTQIEQLEGQFNYLNKQIGFSSITVTMFEELPFVYDSTQRKGFGARIISAMDSGWQGFLSFLIGLASFWPFLVLFAGGVLLFRRYKRGRGKKES